MSKHVRLGIIGMGNIGQHHATYLQAGQVPGCELAAVADAFPDKLSRYAPLPIFASGEELIQSGKVDAVVIATPHYQHTSLGIAALKAGLHVMVEKPISAHKADAERLIAVAEAHRDQVFAGMFQLRAEPRYLKLQKLIQDGDLGEIVRFNWVITDWYRTAAYYASGGWRATWKGEGGGVLLNQCLHNLDVVAWLLGAPARVRGFAQLGRFHDIEVEDNVTAFLEWPNRATGVFITSTGEAPGTNRLELCGTRGKVVLENHRLTFTRNEADMIEFSRAAKLGFAKPDVWHVEIPFENHPGPHAALMKNFVAAVLDGAPLIAPGAEGIHSVELANALLYSGLRGETIEMPMDGAAFERKLQQLIAESRHEKKVVAVSNEDFANSFRR